MKNIKKIQKEAIDNFRRSFKLFMSEKEVYQHLIFDGLGELLIKLKEYTLQVKYDSFVFYEPVEKYRFSYLHNAVVGNKLTTEQFKELAEKAKIKTKKTCKSISNEEYKMALENAKYNVRYI